MTIIAAAATTSNKPIKHIIPHPPIQRQSMDQNNRQESRTTVVSPPPIGHLLSSYAYSAPSRASLVVSDVFANIFQKHLLRPWNGNGTQHVRARPTRPHK